MKIEKRVIGGMIIVLVLAVALASASFDYSGNNLKTNYIGGEKISGKITLNLSDEPVNSEFTSNFPGKISLLDLIDENDFVEGEDYNCSVEGCENSLETVGNALNTYNFPGGDKLVGFKLNGNNIDSISKITLDIRGDMPQSCSQQLSVKLADRDDFIFQNTKIGSSPCGIKDYGCFSSSEGSVTIDENSYCEEIGLPSAPAYEIGAKITAGSSNATINARLLDENDNELASCVLPDVVGYNETSCVVNYTGSSGETYKVCISADSGTDYKLNYEQSGKICGTSPTGSDVDYEIFGRAMAFGSPVEIKIDSGAEGGLLDYILSYLDEIYGGSCPSTGCIVPLKIIGQPQTVTFNNEELSYNSDVGGATSNSIYLLQETTPTVTANNLEFELEKANFTIPVTSSARVFELELGGESVRSIPINITKGFSFDINPKFVPVGITNTFTIKTSQNISSVMWNFGDGTGEFTTTGNSTSHKYTDEGTFTASIELTDSSGQKAKKDFSITAGDAEKSVEILIDDYETRLENITKQINSFPEWIKTEIEKKVDVSSLNDSIDKAKTDLNYSLSNATTVLNTLSELSVPYSITTSKISTIPLAIGYGQIDTDLLAKFEDKELSKPEETKNAIINWIIGHYDISVKSKEISSFDENGKNVLLMHFTLDLKNKTKNIEDANLFINYPLEEIIFKEDYGQKTVSSGTYIPLNGEEQHIEILVPQEIDFASLGVYASPPSNELSIGFIGKILKAVGPHFEFSWATFIILLVVLTVIFLVAYIAIQEWMKRNYEQGLFPNPDDLYNLITFIRNSKNKGVKDEEIIRKLKLNGWRKEQIDYAFKKMRGERLLRFEIPLFRKSQKKNVEKEIAKRGGRPERFIKRRI